MEGCSFLVVTGGSELATGCTRLSTCAWSSSPVVVGDSSLLVVGETSSVLVEVSSVIVTSDSSRVAAKNSAVPF